MAVKFGMTVLEIIGQLTNGFRKVMGRDPDGLEKIKERGSSIGGYRKQDIVEGAARMRKGKPGKSFIEIDKRVKREILRDYYKNLPPPPKAPPKGKK